MKKYIGIFAAMLLCALLALSAFAAETVVYVNDGGTGDGSSASAPLGNMTEAISKIANGGKVVIVDTYTCPDEYHEPTHKGNITISGGKYIFTNGSYNRWFLEGPGSTTFENITFEYGEGSTSLFLAQFFPLTFGEGVVTPAEGKVYVVGGYQYTQDGVMSDAPKYDADSHITIKSGTYWAVSGFSRGPSTEEYTGTSHIVVDGGTISTVYGAAINGSYAANSEIIVNGGNVQNLRTAGDQTRRINGNSTVTVNGGMIGLLSMNNVMGHTTVNYNGGNIAMAEKTVEPAVEEFVTDGTTTLVAAPGVETKLLAIFFDEVNAGGKTPVTTAPEKTTEPVKTTEPTKTEEPAKTTEDTKDAAATEDTTASETTTGEVTTEPTKTEPTETTPAAEKTTDTEKAADTSAPETTAAPAPASEGGLSTGAIIGIVAAVIVVIAVVVVVIVKKKK